MRVDDDDILLELAKYLSGCDSTSRIAAKTTSSKATYTPLAVAQPPPSPSKPPPKGSSIWEEELRVDVGHDVVANLYMVNILSRS